MLGLPPVALSGGGRCGCCRFFRRQAMAASVPRAAHRLHRAQDQFFMEYQLSTVRLVVAAHAEQSQLYPW